MIGHLARPKTVFPAGEDFLLLPPAQQAFAYRNVDQMFATRTIRRGEDALPLAPGPEIDVRYTIDGMTIDIDAFISRANIAGLLVLKDDRLVLERYSLGLAEDGRWTSMSMVKSLTSSLVGAALHEGAIASLDDTVARYVRPLRGSVYEDVRIKDLLTMSSGIEWNEDYTDRQSHVNRYSKSLGERVPGGVLDLMKGLKRRHAPGAAFSYNTGDTYVLGCLVSAAVDMPLADYMSQRIWTKAGMEFDAFYTLESLDGQEIGGSRAGITLRDLGRFGRFILADGIAGAERILPSGWVEMANRKAFVFPPDGNSYGAVGYGYSWWIDADGAMVAVGFAGQTLYINRSKCVVIATLSCQPQPPYAGCAAVDMKRERALFKNAVLET